MLCLGQARFFSWNIAPFLDDRFLHLPWVGSGSGANLFRHIHTLLSGLQLGHKLGHMRTGSLRFKGTLFLGSILHNSLSLVVTNFRSLLKSTSSRGTELSGFFSTASNWCVLDDSFLFHITNFSWPL